MAGIEFNAIIQSMSGRMGDRVFYRRNGRCFVRTYVKPDDPRTEKQAGRRDAFARLVTGWREIDETERDEWRRRARRKNMSGYNLYISEGMKESDSKREREPRIQVKMEQKVPLRRVMRREKRYGCSRYGKNIFPSPPRSSVNDVPDKPAVFPIFFHFERSGKSFRARKISPPSGR